MSHLCLSNIVDLSLSLLPFAVTIIIIVVLSIPALSTEVAVYLPGRLRVVIEHAQLAITDRAKVQLFIIVCILFLIARLTQ